MRAPYFYIIHYFILVGKYLGELLLPKVFGDFYFNVVVGIQPPLFACFLLRNKRSLNPERAQEITSIVSTREG